HLSLVASGGSATVNAGVSSAGGPFGGGGMIGVTALGGSVTVNAGVSTAVFGAVGLTATGGGIAVNAAVTTDLGQINADAAGAINQGAGGRFETDTLLATRSAGGQVLTGANSVGQFNATNTGGNVTLTNATTNLAVTGVLQSGGGSVSVTNA